MTAFNLYQRATCQIGEGDTAGAVKTLRRAVAALDRKGDPDHVRGEIVELIDALGASE